MDAESDLPSVPPATTLPASVLDRTPSLREMADRDGLRELCERLAGVFGVGVALYDLEGEAIVPPAAPPPYCAERCRLHGETDRCVATKESVAVPLPDRDRHQTRECFTGLRYQAVSVRSGTDAVGIAVIGPFESPDRERSIDALAGSDAPERAKLQILRREIPVLEGAELESMVDFAGGLFELFLFAQLKTYLTAHLHLESVNDSFRELQSKNRELRAGFEKLKALDVLKSNFLATVSHELRTPLTSIIGYGEMVLDGIGGKVPPAARKQIALIVQKGEQLLHLINSVLDITKIESGRMELNVEQVRLRDLVEDALASVRPQAKKKLLSLAAKVPDDVPGLTADNYKLRQVLVNLLGNAVKFTPERGKVSIAARRIGRGTGGKIEIRVSDSGVGIAAEHQAKVFERFYQVDNSSTRQYGGTGLGLPLVRSFVEMHGGTIRVESALGNGTTFIVVLPLQPPPRAPVSAPGMNDEEDPMAAKKRKSARYRAGLKRKQVKRRARVSRQPRVKSGPRNPRKKK